MTKKKTSLWEVGFVGALMVLFAMTGLMSQPMEANATGGLTVSVMGFSTGTAAAGIRSSAGTFMGIKLASAAAGGYIKCFNVAAAASATLDREVDLLDVVVATAAATAPAAQNLVANVQSPSDVKSGGLSAGTGITCIKSAAGDIWLVYSQP